MDREFLIIAISYWAGIFTAVIAAYFSEREE